MTGTRPRVGTARYVLLLLASVACSRDVPNKEKAAPASNAPVARTGVLPPSALAAVWDTGAGQWFVIAGTDSVQAYAVDPTFTDAQNLDAARADPASLVGTRFDLLSPLSPATQVRIDSVFVDSTRRCAAWPAVHLIGEDGQAVRAAWQVAFPPGRVTAVPFDSLPALSQADSIRLTILVARLASTAPGDTAAVFRGRPYVVRQAHRFALDDGRRAVLAEVTRVVNQEANPLQEELVLLAESDDSTRAAPLSIAFVDRQIGLEEAVESFDLLAAMRMRNGVWAVLVRREVGDGFRLVLIERVSPGKWHLRWRSAYANC